MREPERGAHRGCACQLQAFVVGILEETVVDYQDWQVWLPMYGSPDMTLSSGELVWFDHPERTDIDPMDIKVGLSNICRYHGQYRYSVLAHSLLVAEILSAHSHRMSALGALHDFHESVVGDQNPREKTEAFRKREDLWSDHIHLAFGVSPADHMEHRFIKFADRAALIAEMEVIGHPAYEWPDDLWEKHGGRPRTLGKAPGLAAVYRDTHPDILWDALMDTIRRGADHGKVQLDRDRRKLVGRGRLEREGVRLVAQELVMGDKRFVV